MIDDGLNYDKTIEKNRIVFNGVTSRRRLLLYMAVTCLPLACMLYSCMPRLVSGTDISGLDYFVLISLLILTVIVLIFMYNTQKNLYQLLTFDTFEKDSRKQIRKYLTEAAHNLKWETYLSTDDYLIFVTPSELPSDDIQAVSLVFFPENRVVFNSLNYRHTFSMLNNAEENYRNLHTEYMKVILKYRTDN